MKPIWNRVKNHIKRNAEENTERVNLNYGEYSVRVHIHEWTTSRDWTYRQIRVNGFGLRRRDFFIDKEYITGVPYYPFHFQPKTREEQILTNVDFVKAHIHPYSTASRETVKMVEDRLQMDDPRYPEPDVSPPSGGVVERRTDPEQKEMIEMADSEIGDD